MDAQPPRGTRDFPPDAWRLRDWLFSRFRRTTEAFGYELYDAPVLERRDWFTRKAGEEIVEQLYTLEDKSGRELALRPELTPQLARLVLGMGRSMPVPLRWGAIGQCWRYERATRGRKREHYQWNLDLLGVDGVEAEAELIAAMVHCMRSMGLGPEDVVLRVNSRRLLGARLAAAGVGAAQFEPVCVLVDKLGKVPREALLEQLGGLGLDEQTARCALAAAGDEGALDGPAPEGEGDDAREGRASLDRLFERLDDYGVAERAAYDPKVVRGLSYYTGTVWEAFDRKGELRAVAGGGRYDRLLSVYGGKDVPAAGFGFGDVVIVELLEERGLLPDTTRQIDEYVAPFGEDGLAAATRLATALRGDPFEDGTPRRVELQIEPGGMKKALKLAARAGARRAWLLTPSELANGQVLRKDLETGEQTTTPLDELLQARAR